MKPAHVSFLLVLLVACNDDPLAPVPQPTRALTDDAEVVITGRVVSSTSSLGIEAANVRVLDAGASVGTDATGHYRIVLPARLRGQTVPVNVRAIGFKQQNRTIALISDVVTVDLPIAMDTFQTSCVLQIVVRTNEALDEPASTAATPAAEIIKHGVRVIR